MENFPISYDFVEKYVRFSKPEYIQQYIYVKYFIHKNNRFPSRAEISGALGVSESQVEFTLAYWVSCGEIICNDGEYSLPDDNKSVEIKKTSAPRKSDTKRKLTRPSYTMAEIDAVASKNKIISGLFYQAEKVLNKVLTQSDMEMLYSFVDWLGLPVEVITMLLSYAAKCGKTGRRYLETVAIDWAERGIDTFEAAEDFVRELEMRDSKEWKVRSVLGIYDRALTATEKKYISQWIEDETISLDLIPLAYDKTISNTGKLSYAYMNKILLSWATEGFTKEEQVENWDGKPTKTGKTVPKKSKFNNYEDSNSVNYDALEEMLLDMMLDD